MARSRAQRRAGQRTGGKQQAQHVRHGRRRLLAGPGAAPAGDPLDHQDQPGVVQVERHAGEQVGGADGGEVHPQGADRDALVGAAGGVHGQQLRVAAQRLAAEAVVRPCAFQFVLPDFSTVSNARRKLSYAPERKRCRH